MKKFSIALAIGALLVVKAGAAQGPELDLTAKRQAKDQTPPAGDCALEHRDGIQRDVEMPLYAKAPPGDS